MATVPIRPKGRPRKPLPEGQPEAEPSEKPKKRVTKLSVMTEEERQAHMKEKSRLNYEKHCEAIKARKAAYKERNADAIRAQQRDRYHRLRLRICRRCCLLLMDTGRGKCSASLDQREPSARATLAALLRDADVFTQGYRPGAIAAHGFGLHEAARLRGSVMLCAPSAVARWPGAAATSKACIAPSSVRNGRAAGSARCRGSSVSSSLPAADSLFNRYQLLRLRHSSSRAPHRFQQLRLAAHEGPAILEGNVEHPVHDHRHSAGHGVGSGDCHLAQPESARRRRVAHVLLSPVHRAHRGLEHFVDLDFHPERWPAEQCARLHRDPRPELVAGRKHEHPALIIMGLWGAGGGMIIWLAGLKSISESYYEAASLDGAGNWQQFLHITLPLLTVHLLQPHHGPDRHLPDFHAGVYHDPGRSRKLDVVLRLPAV